MATEIRSGPRRYLLAVLAVALILLVPLMFLLVTLVGRLVEPEPGGDTVNGWIILWALLGLVVAGLVVGSIVMIARGTRQARLEHEAPQGGEHRTP